MVMGTAMAMEAMETMGSEPVTAMAGRLPAPRDSFR